MDLIYVKGDLLSSPTDISLAHCVSQDLKMGKGIAVQFKNKFGNVDKLYEQHKKIGEVACIKINDRYIFNLITKERYFNKPNYDNLRSTLQNLRLLCDHFGIKKLGMPKIGCGLDKLKWSIVENMIKIVFFKSTIQIYIYHL